MEEDHESPNPRTAPRPQYFGASLAIHVKQCEKLWEERERRKPERERRACPTVDGGGGTALMAATLPTLSPRERREWNERAFASFNDVALVPCASCGRTFTPEALLRHAKAYTPARPLCGRRTGARRDGAGREGKPGKAGREGPGKAAVEGPPPGKPPARPRAAAAPPASSRRVGPPPAAAAGSSGLRRAVEENAREIRELRALVREQQRQIDALAAAR